MPRDPTLLGSYRVGARLGAGGTSIVYAVEREGCPGRLALKLLRAHLTGDPIVVARFRREVRLLSAIAHPGVVPVVDSGEDSGRYFLVMPFIDHPTLAARLDEVGCVRVPGPHGELLSVAVSVLTALEAIHQKGIVHRDITPANVFVTPSGQGLLADFGIVKILGSESILTRTGALLGTVPYMAPEQLSEEPVGPRTDIYQMGLILYRMVVGRLPFDRTLPDAVRAKCLEPALPDPRELGASVPGALVEVVRRATVKEPSGRFGSAARMAAALSAALR